MVYFLYLEMKDTLTGGGKVATSPAMIAGDVLVSVIVGSFGIVDSIRH